MKPAKEWFAQYQIPDREPFWFGSVVAHTREEAIKLACAQKSLHFTADTQILAISPGRGTIFTDNVTDVPADACCKAA